MAGTEQSIELALTTGRSRDLRGKSIIVESNRSHPGGDRDGRTADGDDGGERAIPGGLRDGCGIADRFTGHGDRHGQCVPGQRARDRVRGAGIVTQLVLLKDLADLLGVAVELGFGGDGSSVGEDEGVGKVGYIDRRHAGWDGAC